jgi:AcrR family transcriptional regulator
MVIRQRAVLAEDKQERREAILDAAERLLQRAPDRVANVVEVADEAGLAKGTVYLYFPSKEELLLALHERHVDDFFRAVAALLDRPQPVTIGDMLELTRTHMVGQPTFLPLATRCFGIMRTEVPRVIADAFKERMAARLATAAAGLERHFPELPVPGGVALLRHSYAMILGLWQMASSDADPVAPTACGLRTCDYPDELARGLTALWRGTLGSALASDAANAAAEAIGDH